MKTLKYLALAAALAVASGCEDEEVARPDGAVTMTDGGVQDGATSGADGGTTADGGAPGDAGTDGGMVVAGDGGITSFVLVDFVTGLVTNSTTPTAVPATLEDKTITDTMDPAAFDKLLGL